jgi:hypothetical protein
MVDQQQRTPRVTSIVETDLPGSNGVHLSDQQESEEAPDFRKVDLHAPAPGELPKTAAEEKAYWSAAEPDILGGLFEAIDADTQDVTGCDFPRITFPLIGTDGKPVIDPATRQPKREVMHVRFMRITDVDVEAASRKARIWIPNPDIPNGQRVPETNQSRMRAWIIYNATVPEDRAKYWDRVEVANRLKAGNGVEVIERLLRVGETLQAINAIYGFSGLYNRMSETDQVKN